MSNGVPPLICTPKPLVVLETFLALDPPFPQIFDDLAAVDTNADSGDQAPFLQDPLIEGSG